MGNEHDGGVQGLLDLHHRVLQMGARQRIQRTERLIHQQYFRLHRQRAGNPAALLHAAGDLPRTLVQRVSHLHAVEVVLDPLFALGLAHGVTEHLIHRQRHVVEAGQPRQQRMVLEHHRALGPRPGDFAVVANQPAFRRQRDPGDKVKQRRLTAAGVADKTHGFALVDIKRDVLQRQKLAAGGGKTLAHGLDLN